MKISGDTNTSSWETAMQSDMRIWLEKEKESEWQGTIAWKDEVTVREISRRADFLVLMREKGLVCVEAKTNPSKLFLEQLKDHARYCDYVFAYVYDKSLVQKWFREELEIRGIGLMVWNNQYTGWKDGRFVTHGLIAEALGAFKQRGMSKEYRKINKKYREYLKKWE